MACRAILDASKRHAGERRDPGQQASSCNPGPLPGLDPGISPGDEQKDRD
jgi:hypothetical protein